VGTADHSAEEAGTGAGVDSGRRTLYEIIEHGLSQSTGLGRGNVKGGNCLGLGEVGPRRTHSKPRAKGRGMFGRTREEARNLTIASCH
jgi:hypothetical protein